MATCSALLYTMIIERFSFNRGGGGEIKWGKRALALVISCDDTKGDQFMSSQPTVPSR